MRQNLLDELRTRFPANTLAETTLNGALLFVCEKQAHSCLGHRIKKTFLEITKPSVLHFELQNIASDNLITHICIDGDFIPYGQEQYDPNNPEFKHKRPDFIVFDNKSLLFVELKLEQEDATFGKEDAKWKKLLEGANQILTFINFCKKEGLNLGVFQPQILGIVCMRFEPNFSTPLPKGNAARNKELFALGLKLGFPVKAQNFFKFE